MNETLGELSVEKSGIPARGPDSELRIGRETLREKLLESEVQKKDEVISAMSQTLDELIQSMNWRYLNLHRNLQRTVPHMNTPRPPPG